jgi:hypothetical protein
VPNNAGPSPVVNGGRGKRLKGGGREDKDKEGRSMRIRKVKGERKESKGRERGK